MIEKNGWEYSHYAGRHKLTHVFPLDGSLSTWTFIATGGVWSFDHYVDYQRTGKRAHYTSISISDRKAKELIERWSRLEEWA